MANSDVYYNVSNAHYYQWVPAGGITWQQAKILAEDAKLNGIAGSYLTGYLATITTPEELSFIDEVVFASGRPENTIIGGSDAAQEGVWRWVTGPEGQANDGAGTVFFASGEYVGDKAAEWQAEGEGDTAEHDYLYIYAWSEPKFYPWNNSTGPINSTGPAGYLIEWGLSQGTPNNDPTGSVRIVGNATPGETVSVDISDVTDPDGFGRFVHYSWYLNGENINWTTTNPLAKDYPVFASDIGKILTVEYSYYDGEGHLETVISDAVEITTVNQNPRLVAFDFSEFKQQTGASVTAPADGFEFLVVIVDGLHYALPYIGEKNGVLLFGDAAASFQSGNVESAYFLARTTDSASFTDRLDYRNSLIRSEFGSLATHADWFDLEGVSTLMSSADLVDYIDISPFPSDSTVGDGAFVTVNGVTNFSSNRAYHIGAHDGTLRNSWLIHDTIDNHQIDLGSYSITELLLAKISIPSTFLTLASGVNFINNAPSITGPVDLGTTPEDAVRSITATELLAGSSDSDGDTLSIVNLTASSGLLVDNANGSWAWTPAANHTSDVTFSYDVTDGKASVAQTATLDLTPVESNPNRFYWDPAVGGNGHFYEFVNSDVTWDAAFQDAGMKTYVGQLGYLVTVTSDDEFNFIISKMNLISVGWNAKTIWVGASDANSEGTFFWMNGPEAGSEFIETDWGWPTGYSGWKPGDDYLSIDVVSNAGYFLTLDQEWFKNGSRTWENSSRYSGMFEGNGYVVEYSPNYTIPQNNNATGAVRIVGNATPGETVFADVSDVSDPDGFGRFVHYSWYLDGVNLSEGRTTTTNPLNNDYPIFASDIGKTLTVQYSFYDGDGHLETVFSDGVKITTANQVGVLPVQFFANTAFRYDALTFGEKGEFVDYETLEGDEIVEITADEAYQEIYEGYDLLPQEINRDSFISISDIVHYNDRFSAYSKEGISFSYPTATSGTFNHFGLHKDYVTYGDGFEWFVANVMMSTTALDAAVSTNSTADDVEFFASVFVGNDEIYLSQFADSFDAGAGNDVMYGFGGNDTLLGGSGNDTLDGGAGNNLLLGGEGNDSYVFSYHGVSRIEDMSGANYLVVKKQPDVWFKELFRDGDSIVLRGTNGSELIYENYDTLAGITWVPLFDEWSEYFISMEDIYIGTSENDVLSSLSLDYTEFYGGGGNDHLCAGNGASWMTGDGGNDTLIGGDGNDGLHGDLRADDPGDDVLVGNDGDDRLHGDAGNDLLLGGAGNDSLHGDGGDDYLQAGTGNDLLLGGEGNDSLHGEAGDDHLVGGSGDDHLDGGDGDDLLEGGDGDDGFVSGLGSDTISGGTGNNTLVYEGSRTEGVRIAFTAEASGIVEGEGGEVDQFEAIQQVNGSHFNDAIIGTIGKQVIYGMEGDDTFFGGGDNDWFYGGEGNDTASFSGNRSDYRIMFDEVSGSYTVSDQRIAQEDGQDTLTNVEFLAFADGTFNVNNVLPGFEIVELSRSGSTVKYGLMVNPDADPGEPGLGSFGFALDYDPASLLFDADTIVFANGVTGLSGEHNTETGMVQFGGYASDPAKLFSDFSMPLLQFEATITDRDMLVELSVADVVFDDVTVDGATATFEYSTNSVTTVVKTRSGVAMEGVEVDAVVLSQSEGMFLRATSVGNGVVQFELVAVPGALVGAVDFTISEASIAEFSLGPDLAGWTAQVNTTEPGVVSVSAIGAANGSLDLPPGEQAVLARFTASGAIDLEVTEGMLGAVAQADIRVNSETLVTDDQGKVTSAFDDGAQIMVCADATFTNVATTRAVTAQDALEALRLSVGMTTTGGQSDAFTFIAADFNENGRVSSQDALEILRYAVRAEGALQADWVFVNTDGDYSSVSRSSVEFEEGVAIANLTDDAEVYLTGILRGDVNDSISNMLLF